ncbi:hypothetical protein E6A47_05450 [Brachyspira pilosicoli]|uniref:Lipoprotein n=1 Tax=Brachyspira pilosicoli P43/6/78 TaxID=1042417 RepID=A0A3B6VJ27_BRAPL|nr:hypothetical protein [Brachyspira pilosicoli]AGA65943.1 hypothetical protein BPP43_03185 [Brachyspira pilosicoli P43/6/78]MBW5391360.1 hypothetical protein [Brachyspira pilosicoli]MBW5399499.1 hypothetical protein [Brachyspira pilosicoli]
MNYFCRILISIVFLVTLISCGLPDITSITQEMNQPFITKITPMDQKIVVEFQAQNNEPAFSGYNIYFGDSVNPRIYRIYSQQKTIPTIVTTRSTTLQTFTFTIEKNIYYTGSNVTEISLLPETEIRNGIPIYVWVSSYQITPQNESYYYYDNYVKMATPRPEVLNQTVNVGSTIVLSEGYLANLTLNTADNKLYFSSPQRENETWSLQRVAGTSLYDIVVPPTEGYTTESLEVIADRLYLIKINRGNNNYYGKIFVRSVNGTSSIVADYCYQISADILSY